MGKSIKLDNDTYWDASAIMVNGSQQTLAELYPIAHKWTHNQTETLTLRGLRTYLVTFSRISASNADVAFVALVCSGASASNTSKWYTIYGNVSNMGSISVSGLTLKITIGAAVYGSLSVLML